MVQSISSASRAYVNTGDDPNALMAAQFGALAKRLEAMDPATQAETLRKIEQRSTTLANDLRDFLAMPATGREQMLQRIAQGLPATEETTSAPVDAKAAMRAQGLQMLDTMRQQDSSAMLAMLDRKHNQTTSFWEAGAADPFAGLGETQAPEAGTESATNAWWSAAASSAYGSNISPKDAFLSV